MGCWTIAKSESKCKMYFVFSRKGLWENKLAASDSRTYASGWEIKDKNCARN